LTYPSADDVSTIHALLWEPEGRQEPRAVLQIVHGASEYVGRYRDYAAFLVEQGFVVCGEDHIGHGMSALSREKLACMPLETGKDVLLADVHTLRELLQKRYPDAPFVLFGHSMGSFIVRNYLTQQGAGLAAAVLSGTGHQPGWVPGAALAFARLTALVKPEDYRSPLLHNMGMGALAKSMPDARTPFDWLATDEAVVDAYVADPLCGEVFSVGAYGALAKLLGGMIAAQGAKQVPPSLPLLFVAGAEDPVGERGAGVERAAALYRDAGVKHVDVKLYAGLRHEIHNEPSRLTVYQDVADWIKDVV
jgi:alpha-beta hydrolase superfamily lysophospholipase